jgi:ribosomal protein S18 acetylase RimI-like enzyme
VRKCGEMAAFIERFDKDRHDTGQVKTLLGMAAGRPTLDKLAYLIDQFYASNGRTMFIATKKGRIKGVIGVEYTGDKHGFITHIAVHPDTRKKGIASRLIKHVVKTLELDEIGAETDQYAVEFYDACGFNIREIESPYAGVRRSRCIKRVTLET